MRPEGMKIYRCRLHGLREVPAMYSRSPKWALEVCPDCEPITAYTDAELAALIADVRREALEELRRLVATGSFTADNLVRLIDDILAAKEVG